MNSGVVMSFYSEKVGFVRMYLKVRMLQNILIRKKLGQLCPAKVQKIERTVAK